MVQNLTTNNKQPITNNKQRTTNNKHFGYAAPALRLRGPRDSSKGSDRGVEGQCRQQTVEIRGFPHYYEWIRGEEKEGVKKPVMVFLHGWGGFGPLLAFYS